MKTNKCIQPSMKPATKATELTDGEWPMFRNKVIRTLQKLQNNAE